MVAICRRGCQLVVSCAPMRRNFHTLLLHPVRAPATGGAPPCRAVRGTFPSCWDSCVCVCVFSPCQCGWEGLAVYSQIDTGSDGMATVSHSRGEDGEKKILRRANKLSKGRCIVCTRAKRAARDHPEHLPKSEPLANNVVKVFWEGG